ncbi:hypothetical protein GCM10023144_32330 [Pigmentiphaga soli]|uniref:Uncharacterized protein n=1 Tax=Pigmentiphaga soli TaxID=1007095 RepID=A0ABP8HC70_9BURK
MVPVPVAASTRLPDSSRAALRDTEDGGIVMPPARFMVVRNASLWCAGLAAWQACPPPGAGLPAIAPGRRGAVERRAMSGSAKWHRSNLAIVAESATEAAQ